MKCLLKLSAAAIISGLLPSVSHADCVANGTIPRVFVQVGAATNIGVRDNGAGTIFFNFTTTNQAVISAALAAQSSHMTVGIRGNAAACSPPVGGLSQGGSVINILVSP